jgi:hypothetical protein
LIPQEGSGNPSAIVRDSFGIDSSRTSTAGSISRPVQDTFNPMSSSFSNQGLVQRQQDIIKQQDVMIMEIGRGVDVLHQQALNINEEAKTQIQILDKLDTNVEKATADLKTEAEHAERIRQTSSICFMYIVIVIEVAVIVLLLILMFSL